MNHRWTQMHTDGRQGFRKELESGVDVDNRWPRGAPRTFAPQLNGNSNSSICLYLCLSVFICVHLWLMIRSGIRESI